MTAKISTSLLALAFFFVSTPSWALTESIVESDIQVRMPGGEELATDLSYTYDANGPVVALLTNHDNALVLKFSNDVAGYQMAMDAFANVMAHQTVLLPAGAVLKGHVVEVKGAQICSVNMQHHYDSQALSICTKR
jgi:hypothetical protein